MNDEAEDATVNSAPVDRTSGRTMDHSDPGSTGLSAIQADPIPESATGLEPELETEPDVIPMGSRVVLATLWILLFGGRWLLVPLLQWAGVLSRDLVIMLDDGPLQKFYLILLSITLVVLALRAVRDLETRSLERKNRRQNKIDPL